MTIIAPTQRLADECERADCWPASLLQYVCVSHIRGPTNDSLRPSAVCRMLRKTGLVVELDKPICPAIVIVDAAAVIARVVAPAVTIGWGDRVSGAP